MTDFLSNVLGNDGIAKMAGEKVGAVVEETVKNVLSGGKGEKEGGKTDDSNSDDKGGFNVGDALSAIGGKKDDDKGGFNVGDALSAIGGKKDEGEGGGGGGLDVANAIGGFFK